MKPMTNYDLACSKMLFLGLGTGMTSGAAAEDRNLTVDAVELLPEVIAAAALFDSSFSNRSLNAAMKPSPP